PAPEPVESAASEVDPPAASSPAPAAEEAAPAAELTPAESRPSPPPQASPPAAVDAPAGGRAARAPGSLRRAVVAYLQGDYRAVVDGLEPDKLRRKSRRSQALLLRAASRYALFLLGGETEYSLRGAAADDIVAARALDADLEPSEGVFSPRFRDFFTATR
ncbi:MAG: hypothetical protein AAFY88_12565, partial [Acidobacteriota bacterium]